jgi:hypothetical protein
MGSRNRRISASHTRRAPHGQESGKARQARQITTPWGRARCTRPSRGCKPTGTFHHPKRRPVEHRPLRLVLLAHERQPLPQADADQGLYTAEHFSTVAREHLLYRLAAHGRKKIGRPRELPMDLDAPRSMGRVLPVEASLCSAPFIPVASPWACQAPSARNALPYDFAPGLADGQVFCVTETKPREKAS